MAKQKGSGVRGQGPGETAGGATVIDEQSTAAADEAAGAARPEPVEGAVDDGEVLQTSVISLADILPPKNQPRTFFDMIDLQDLAQDMMVNGQIQPIRVRREGDKYRILWGERRYRAAGLNEWPTIRAEVEGSDTPEISADELLFRQLSENAARASLSPVEEGHAYKRLVDAGHDVAEIAERVRQSASYVYTRMNFAKSLTPHVVDALNRKLIAPGHAERFCALTPEQQQIALDHCNTHELSVREFREYVESEFHRERAEAKDAPPEHRASFSCDCGFNVVDDTGDLHEFDEAVWNHQETCAHTRKAPVEPTLGDISEQGAVDQLAADAKPVERRAELPSGPVADRGQVNNAKRAESDKFEVGVRKRIVGKIIKAANGSAAGLEFIRQFFARIATEFGTEYPEEFKLLRELMPNVSFSTVADLYKPFQGIIGMEIVGYCEAETVSAQLERPKALVELAKLAGVSLAKCEEEEKAAIAGMPAKTSKAPKKSKLRKDKTAKPAKSKKTGGKRK